MHNYVAIPTLEGQIGRSMFLITGQMRTRAAELRHRNTHKRAYARRHLQRYIHRCIFNKGNLAQTVCPIGGHPNVLHQYFAQRVAYFELHAAEET